MIYVSDLLKHRDMKKIIQKTGMGVEGISFSIADCLDQFNQTVKKYRSYLEYLDTDFLTLHGPFLDLNPTAFDSRILEVTQYRFSQAYEAGLQLGAKKIIYHTGFLPSVHFSDGWDKRMAEFWNSFLEDRKEIQILIENVLDPAPAPIKSVKSMVPASNFGLCLDIGHANCYSCVSVEQWISCYGSDLKHAHIHNNNGTRDSHHSLKDGTLCGQQVLELIRTAAPNADYTIECNTPSDVLSSYEFFYPD